MNIAFLINESSYLALFGVFLLLIGEIFAFSQRKDLLKVLLISAVAEIGYILMGFGMGSFEGLTGGVLHLEYQLVIRVFVFILAFVLISKVGSRKVEDLSGLGKHLPLLVTLFGFGLFAIMGLSPFKGSISKFLIIYSAIENGEFIYAGIGILGSIIEASYFIYIIQKICFEKPESENKFVNIQTKNTIFLNIILASFLGFIIYISLFPDTIIRYTEHYIINTFGLSNIKELPMFEKPWPIIVLVPYISAFLLFFIGKFEKSLRNFFAVGVSFFTVYLVFQGIDSFNELSKLFSLIMAVIGFIITLYSVGYFKNKEYSNRYFFFLFLMQGTLLGVTTSTDFASFYLFWELMTWTSYLLVIHEQTKKALKAGFKYFIMCTSGAYLMLFAILILHSKINTFDINFISQNLNLLSPNLLLAVLFMFIVAFAVKAGLVPLHSWLPDAHPVAPSSISAPMSGILTKAGIYGLVLVLFVVFGNVLLNELSLEFNMIKIGIFVSILGAITLIYGEIMALYQTDIKRMLAYSTMAQIGEIVVTLGLGTYLSLLGSLTHVLNHSIMKNLLFLAVGALIYRVKSQEIDKFKGIGTQMPITSFFFSIGILAIMGLPPFNGFISKFLMLYASVQAGHIEIAVLILFGSVIGAFYYIKLIRIIFFEKYEGKKVEEAPVSILLALAALTSLVLLNGLYPQLSIQLVKSVVDFISLSTSLEIQSIPNINISWSAIVLIPTLGALATFILGKRKKNLSGILAVSVMVLTLIALYFTSNNYDIYSLSFAVLIAFIAVLNLLYNIGYMSFHGHAKNRFYMFFLLMIAGLLGVAVSNDLFNFFFFWEIMSSWTLYFVIIHEQTQTALKEGFKYFICNYIGASFMFLGVIVLCVKGETFSMKLLANSLENISLEYLLLGICLVLLGLLMKAAMLPVRIDYQMHPEAAPTPVSGYISAVLLKSAPFSMAKLFFVFGGIALLSKFGLSNNLPTIMYVVAWISAITIFIAASMALLQSSLKLLLIYHTVSQMGYIILGISLGSSLGVAGGLLHLVNHMLFKDLLFLVAGVIMVKTGIKTLDRLGGLGKKMPVTLTVFAIAAFSIAGIPPFNGFTSKWLIYQASMQEGYVFLALLSLIASVLTLASFMKFLHSAFFGQLSKANENVTEAPITMLIPMIILALACIVFGVFPGLLLSFIAQIQVWFGLVPVDVNLFGVDSNMGAWNAGIISLMLLAAFLIGISFYFIGNRKVRYTEIYTCGVTDLKPEEIHVNSHNLYESPKKLIKGTLKGLQNIFALNKGV